MNVATLRIAFALLATLLLVLFYTAAYRPTRTAFSGWWTGSLALFLLATVAYLGEGTWVQAVANPVGNGLAVAGAEAAWCAARSLRARPVHRLLLPLPPAVAVVAAAIGHPASNEWAGGETYLALMAIMFAAASAELVSVGRWHTSNRRNLDVEAYRTTGERSLVYSTSLSLVTRALALASGLVALYYAARTVALDVAGPHDAGFNTWFGAAPTTMLLMLQMVTVSFSMSALSTAQQTENLRQRAIYDQLTGLMRAQEFRAAASKALPTLAARGEVALIAMADLDHFKQINDHFGHAVGDQVLRTFGRVARSSMGGRALIGRIGGEEFAIAFPARSVGEGEALLADLAQAFRQAAVLPDQRSVTVSIGMAQAVGRGGGVSVADGATLAALLDRADAALYQAKASGRDRIIHG